MLFSRPKNCQYRSARGTPDDGGSMVTMTDGRWGGRTKTLCNRKRQAHGGTGSGALEDLHVHQQGPKRAAMVLLPWVLTGSAWVKRPRRPAGAQEVQHRRLQGTAPGATLQGTA